MNLKINKAILRIWRKSYANSPGMNETFDGMQNITEFDLYINNYMLFHKWTKMQYSEGVNIMFYSETRALE